MTETLSLRFEGAARTVTGSRHRVRLSGADWLFDCGLYQGRRDEADRVNRTFYAPPADLATVVVSHAHLDHIGNLPTLVANGYAGPIHVTSATADLCRVMLEDSVHLMERDVEHVNRRHPRKPREPLYRPEDVERTLELLVPHPYRTSWSPLEGVSAEYFDAGHILGSALTTFEIRRGGRTLRLGMSGDLGRPGRRILRDPETPPGVEVLVMESTYGDRLHSEQEKTERELVEVIERTAARGGRVMVPSFALGRTQELVATLHDLMRSGRLRELPIFVDSPMAWKTTDVFRAHPECFDGETRRAFEQEDGAPFGFDRLHYVSTGEQSRALNDRRGPFILIAASGMCEGGRILHHLRFGIGEPRNTVLFVGYQAEGTLGRRIRDGVTPVNIFGEPFERRCEVAALDGFSAHADQAEIVSWVKRLTPAPRTIFLVHGEPGPAETLAGVLREALGSQVHVPGPGEEFPLWN